VILNERDLVVSQDKAQVYVSRGGEKPSPLSLVTLTIRGEVAMPGLKGPTLAIEMTVGQTKHLVNALLAAAGARAIHEAQAETPPETT